MNAMSPKNMNSPFRGNNQESIQGLMAGKQNSAQMQMSPKASLEYQTRGQNMGSPDLERDDNHLNAQKDGPQMDSDFLKREDVQRVGQKDKQINELSDMVKELMKEQKELRQQLDDQANQKQHMPPRKGGLNKRAAERVPR